MRRSIRLSLLSAMTLLCFALLLLPSIASADSGLDGVLGDLEWGMSHSQVIEVSQKQIMAEYQKEAVDLIDTHKRDKLRRTFTERATMIEKSYTELKDGERSGLEVSIVFDEFAKGNGESCLKVRDKIATRYFFFVNDQLYKISVAYSPEYVGDIDFPSFLGSVAGKYGDHKETFEDDLAQIIEAVWERDTTRLRVKDRSLGYQAFLMTFSNKPLEAQVETLHAKLQDEYLSEPTVGASISELENDTINDNELGDGGAAADLLGDGGQTEFDLEAHLTPEEAAALKNKIGDGQGGNAKGGAGGGDNEVKKVAKRKRKKKSKKKQKLDGIKAQKGGEDVIIY